MLSKRVALLTVLCAMSTLGYTGLTSPAHLPHSVQPEVDGSAVARGHVRPLPFFYDLFTFRGRGGRTTILTAYAVEAGKLETESAESGVRYRFSVTLALVDTALRSVLGTHDTVFVNTPRPLDGDHLLYTHVAVQAPPSGTTRQRVIMTDATAPGIGQLYTDDFPIPDYTGDHLMLSDIAFGYPDAMSGWKRGDVTLALLPTTQFPSSAFDVYYEIYNLPAGNAYTTEIAVERTEPTGSARAGDRRPVRLLFSGESGADRNGMLAELRRVETSLPRGSYRLTVTITDRVTGASASRSRLLEVREWERGATMVAAMPDRLGHGGAEESRRP
jgi:hypothetical protein